MEEDENVAVTLHSLHLICTNNYFKYPLNQKRKNKIIFHYFQTLYQRISLILPPIYFILAIISYKASTTNQAAIFPIIILPIGAKL